MRAIEKFEQTIIAIDEIKAKIKKNTGMFIKELRSEDDNYHTVLITKALTIYSVAKGIEHGLFDKKYEKDIIIAWEKLQKKILKEDVMYSLDNWTSGALLLAGKEVSEILNVKR
jgi:rhamnogalacturonyl hydrolase YesR